MKMIRTMVGILLIAAMVLPSAISEETESSVPPEEIVIEETYEAKEAPAEEEAPVSEPVAVEETAPTEDRSDEKQQQQVEMQPTVETQPTSENKSAEEPKSAPEEEANDEKAVNESSSDNADGIKEAIPSKEEPQETIKQENTENEESTTENGNLKPDDSVIEGETNTEEGSTESEYHGETSESENGNESSDETENESSENSEDSGKGSEEESTEEYSIVMNQDGNDVKSSYMYTNETDIITFRWSLINKTREINEATFTLVIVNAEGEELNSQNVNSCTLSAGQFKGTNRFKIEAYLNGISVCKTERLITFTPETVKKEYNSYRIQVLCDGEPVQSLYSAENENIVKSVTWQLFGDTDEGSEVIENAVFNVTVTRADGSIEGPLNGSLYTFTADHYIGKNLISIEALLNGEQVSNSTCEIEFTTIPRRTQPAKGMQAAGRGASKASFGSSSGVNAEQQGIEPGKSLIDTHAAGSKNMTSYAGVDPIMEETGVHFEQTGAEIRLDKGIYTAEIIDEEIRLESVTDGTAWIFTGLSLKTLDRAGISSMILSVGDSQFCLKTNTEPKGYYYGKLRSQGLVSADFKYVVTENGITITVCDEYYTIDENSELQPA